MFVARKVFISHSGRDSVLARLIAHVLEQKGIKCFLSERDLHPGRLFDKEIIENIWHSHLVLLLLSANSVSNPWVNQEVSVALGQDIPVWPIAVEDIKIEGAIHGTEGWFIHRSPDPHDEVCKLADAIISAEAEEYGNLKLPIPEYVFGKIGRTKRMVELLNSEYQRMKPGYTLRSLRKITWTTHGFDGWFLGRIV